MAGLDLDQASQNKLGKYWQLSFELDI